MATQVAGDVRRSVERRFYVGLTLAMLATVFLGFARGFFLRPWFPDWPTPPEPIFYVHGAFFTAWCLLLVLQPSLVAVGRTDLHRKLGWLGAALALAMLGLGTYGALVAARRPTGFVGIPVPPLQFLAVPIADMLLFGSLVGLGIAKRRDPQGHKRLMILASVNLMTAAIARWPLAIMAGGPPVFFALTDVFVLALAGWDLATQRRLHRVTLWGGLAILVSQPLRLALSGTAAWLAFAGWAVALLG